MSVSAQQAVARIAAGVVVVLFAVSVTGCFEDSKNSSAETTSHQAATDAPKRTSKEPGKAPAKAPAEAPAKAEPAKPEKVAAPICADCGVIESIKAVEVKGEGSGAGAVVGAVAGIVVGNQIGEGKGRKLARVAGAVGGAYAGNEVEKNVRKTVEYHIAVRMEDGSNRTITQKSNEGLSEGARVRIVNGAVVKN